VIDTEAKTTDRLEAARILLERGWGKAPIALETDGQPTSFVLVSAFGVAAEAAHVAALVVGQFDARF
jgi:hypothetical protein